MEWYTNRPSKRNNSISASSYSHSPSSSSLISSGSPLTYTNNNSQQPPHRSQFFNPSSASSSVSTTSSFSGGPPQHQHHNQNDIMSSVSPNLAHSPVPPIERNSYYFSQFPLYCSDWTTSNDLECIALSTYKEGFTNKLQVVHGLTYENDYRNNNSSSNSNHNNNYSSTNNHHNFNDDDEMLIENVMSPKQQQHQQQQQPYQRSPRQHQYSFDDDIVEGFYFHKVAETAVDYPITHLQWDPLLGKSNEQRLAASSEVLRLYEVDQDSIDQNQEYSLIQTHLLANNTANNSTTSTNGNGTHKDDLNTYPPVTSFDWNKTDPNIVITSSVDTTCTVWDLHRSIKLEDGITISSTNTATVKTQLIAHDSEVFDVKFIHNSTNIFASVGNDGSMRVFDLRSLEHSTIIYEPSLSPPHSASSNNSSLSSNSMSMATLNSKALLKLSTSNIDQHHLATIGINSNQIIIIDMRMPGLPIATLDGSLGGVNHAPVNSIKWHPTSNLLLSGGDDCQALIWDCTNFHQSRNAAAGVANAANNASSDMGIVIDTPSFAYEEDLEVNNVSWRGGKGDWLGVVSGKGFQGVQL